MDFLGGKCLFFTYHLSRKVMETTRKYPPAPACLFLINFPHAFFWEKNVSSAELAVHCLVRVGVLEEEEYKGVTQALFVGYFLFLSFEFIGDPGSPGYHQGEDGTRVREGGPWASWGEGLVPECVNGEEPLADWWKPIFWGGGGGGSYSVGKLFRFQLSEFLVLLCTFECGSSCVRSGHNMKDRVGVGHNFVLMNTFWRLVQDN